MRPATVWAGSEFSSSAISPPLVSLVLINWNYAAYVGAAIDSIKTQDYRWFEAIVIDNGSTDESRDVIAQHVAGDARFQVFHLEKNLGQLGAFLHTFGMVNGEFVTIVDADDILFPDFLSSHVQVHLALPHSVALTSSNVVEMTASGRVLTGGYAPFDLRGLSFTHGLRRPEAALRLPTISELSYRSLSDATSTHLHGGNWIWGPGTSNMYRRSTLALVHYQPKDGTYFRAADNYLCPFCHVFGGSALIDKRLSAYRVHDANYYAERELICQLPAGRIEFRRHHQRHTLETLAILFSRAEFFTQVLPRDAFWRAVDQLSYALEVESGKSILSSVLTSPVSDNYVVLERLFGVDELLAQLRRRLRPRDLQAVLRDAHGGRTPVRLRMKLLRKDMKAALEDLFSKEINVLEQKHKSKQKDPDPPVDETPFEFGSAAILSFDPPIFYCGIAFGESIGIAPAFGKLYGSLPAGFIIYPTWTIDEECRARRVIEAAKAHQEEYPAHHLVFLCNTAGERDRLLNGELEAHLLNKNFTVSDRIFRPLPNAQVEFDAVYNARFDPWKRHELAGKIPRVAYISYATRFTGKLRDQRAAIVDTLARHSGHALLNPVKDGLPVSLPLEEVNQGLNRAAVGLCLSNVEGSNYASMEYMLAGLPIVSTPSIGGREVYFDHEFCTICEPKLSSVRDAVQKLAERNIPREYIRDRTLAKIEPERQRFLALIDNLSERLGGKRRYQDGAWPFGEKSSLVTWKKYREHLNIFEKGRGATVQGDNEPLSHADIESLLSKTQGVQMQPAEVLPIVRAIRSRPGCSLLVFGCGNNSRLWEDVNNSGTTAFIEDDPACAENIQTQLKDARVYRSEFGTRLSEWVSLLNAGDNLKLDLPEEVTSRLWDVIVVDGPAGYADHEKYTGREAPGRMKSIYMASRMVAPGGAVFVHDCDRLVEQQYANRYLGSHRIFVSVKGRALLQGYAF